MTGIVTTVQQAPGRATVAQRWLARGAIFVAGASALVPLLAISFRGSLAVALAVLAPLVVYAAREVLWRMALTVPGTGRG